MRAAQLIYTSWKNGNSAKKGFMVYSKTLSINEIEEDEILSVMKYNPPRDLPIMPTKEDLEYRFPKNLSYFKLSSGKYCIAQSSYLGTDYSGRIGNYIIHAFVFDSVPDFDPVTLVGSKIFRTSLTEAELNANEPPKSLEYIDVLGQRCENCNSNIISSVAINENELKVINCVLDSLTDEKSNYHHFKFIANESDNYKWLIAINSFLPVAYREQFFFSTYRNQENDRVPFVLVRSVAQSSYEAMSNDTLIIDASTYNESVHSNVYVKRALSLCKVDCKYLSAFTNIINVMIKSTDCKNLPFLTLVNEIKSGNLKVANSEDEFYRYMDFVFKDRSTTSKAYDRIYSAYLGMSYPQTAKAVEFKNKIFSYLSTNQKENILLSYINFYLYDNTKNPDEIYEYIKTHGPSEWNEIVDIIINGPLYVITNEEKPAALYFASRVWIDKYQTSNEIEKNDILQIISDIYIKLFNQGKINLCARIINVMASAKLRQWQIIYASVCRKESAMQLTSNVDNLFNYLSLVKNNPDMFWKVLMYAIYQNSVILKPSYDKFNKLVKEDEDYKNLQKSAQNNDDANKFVMLSKMNKLSGMEFKNICDAISAYVEYVKPYCEREDVERYVLKSFIDLVQTLMNSLSVSNRIKLLEKFYGEMRDNMSGSEVNKKLFFKLSEFAYEGLSLHDIDSNVNETQMLMYSNSIKARLVLEGRKLNSYVKKPQEGLSIMVNLLEKNNLRSYTPNVRPEDANEFCELFLENIITIIVGAKIPPSKFMFFFDKFVLHFSNLQCFDGKLIKYLNKSIRLLVDYYPAMFDYIYSNDNNSDSRLVFLTCLKTHFDDMNNHGRLQIYSNTIKKVIHVKETEEFFKLYEKNKKSNQNVDDEMSLTESQKEKTVVEEKLNPKKTEKQK